MNLLRTLVVALGLAFSLLAQRGGGDSVTGQEPPVAGQEKGHGKEPAQSTMQMKEGDFFMEQYKHLVPHPVFGHGEPIEVSADTQVNSLIGKAFVFYNVNLFQLIALALILLVFIPVKASFATAGPSAGLSARRAPWLVRVFRGWVHWIRDEMVYAVMGKETGKKYAPFFCFLFFFIAFMNVIGLIPGSVTATATVFVTGALALITFFMIVGGGIREQGFAAFFKNLLPHGLPLPLVPLMVVVEGMGLFIKPVALTIRLFANMLAGHLVIYSFIGLIFLFAKMMNMSVFAWATAIPATGMAVFIYVIEGFVALLQAYIFTYLSLIFVQFALHPEH